MDKLTNSNDGFEYTDDPAELHDIDFYAFGGADWEFEGQIPIVDGHTLNQMFPKGGMPKFNAEIHGNRQLWAKKMMLIYLEWKQIQGAIGWYFNEKFGDLEELDQFKFENVLLNNGTGALFHHPTTDKYYFLPYTVIKKDAYGEPLEIKINAPRTNFHNYKPDKFVIINDTLTKYPLYNQIIEPISAMIDVLTEIKSNLFASIPKGVIPNLKMSDKGSQGQVLAHTFNGIAKTIKRFFVMNFTEQEMVDFRTTIQNNPKGEFFFPIELTNQTELLIKNLILWQQKINQIIGLPVNFNMDKPERNVVSEISTQQGLSEYRKKERLMLRKLGFDKVNKVFGLNWTIDWDEEDQEPELEETEENDDGNQDK